ncbi:hypothetical protein GBA52_010171 [Prunus armeniaca]|nr:hypothetical protein GBA52_010171 [Prunus armeniaca]
MANPLLLADCFRKLQDVCYDMDDVLDEYEYKNLRMQVLKPKGSMKEKVHNLFSIANSVMSSYKMGHRIKNMRKRLGEIAAQNLSSICPNELQICMACTRRGRPALSWTPQM